MVKRRARSLSPQQLAVKFIDGQMPLSISDMLTADSAGWEAVTEAVRRSYPNSLSLSELCALEDRLRAAIPGDLHAVLRDYSDGQGTEEMIATDAAFIVGVEVGRRLGGAR